MFNKKNDPLIESVKGVMEQNELHRRVEAAVNEHFGIESRSALPHEHHAEYDAVLAEAKKCSIEEGEVIDFTKEKDKKKEEKIGRYVAALAGPKKAKEIMKKRKKDDDGLNESEHKPDSPEHHRAMAIRAHKAMKAGDKSEITANKKKRHEKAYKEMTGSKIKYPDSMNEENDEGSTPRNAKERALAKLHGNPKKITHGDVLKGRGVVEEEKATKSQEDKMGKVMGEFKRGKLHSGSKKGPVVTDRKQAIAIGLDQAGLSNKKLEEEMDIDLIMEEIRSNLLEELNYVYENYDEASFADYVNSLSEEQLEILGLLDEEDRPDARGFIRRIMGGGGPGTEHMGVKPPAEQPKSPSFSRDQQGATKVGSTHAGTKDLAKGNVKKAFDKQTTAAGTSSGDTWMGPKATKIDQKQTATANAKKPVNSAANNPNANSPMAKPAGMSAPKPTTRPGAARPGATPAARPNAPTTRPGATPAARPNAPTTRPGAARPAARPGQRPTASTGRVGRDGMNMAQRRDKYTPQMSDGSLSSAAALREGTEKPQIKESFEQFVRKFLKG